MSDIAFPAHLVVTKEVDDNGLPILTAVITPADGVADDPLPAGHRGPEGPRGIPGTMFAKQGEIADEAARPVGLTAADRGKWWHRLDDNGMDVWTGTGWQHSLDAVGPQGPVADPNTLAVTTTHDPALTTAAADIAGTGAAQTLTVTAPAGLRGPAGPPGASGAIATATDFDDVNGPSRRSMFTLGAGGTRWQVQPPPGGFGPWSWYQEDFPPDQTMTAVDKITVGTFTIPALPFRWRPLAYGHMHAGGTGTASGLDTVVYVRLGSANGVMVANGSGARAESPKLQLIPLIPAFGDEGTKSLSPTSQYATVPANQAATLVMTVEREGSSNQYESSRAHASLTVWALPV